MDFVTRPEFEEHKNHMDSRFNTLENNIKEVKQELTTTRLELKTDINNLGTEFKEDINNLRKELKTDINNLRTELKQDIKSLRVERKHEDSYYSQHTDKELKKDFTSFSDENTKLYIKEMKRADTIRFITYVLLIIGFFGIILGLY